MPIVKPEELLRLKKTGESFLLADARAGKDAQQDYILCHLEGAVFADAERNLAEKTNDASTGGRHPLPAVAKFCEALKHLGISANTRVIIYDDKNGANAAARFWWMLRAVGHTQVRVLDGGYDAAIKAGFPTSSGEEKHPLPGNYAAEKWLLPLADIHEVEEAAKNNRRMVIDVRDAYRYNGESEPIDFVAGHIPGAVNIPFSENLNEQGFFLQPEELKKKYTEATGEKNAAEVIVHCGSGITACHTLLAMDYAGLEIPKLYVGSWSEWSRTGRAIGKK